MSYYTSSKKPRYCKNCGRKLTSHQKSFCCWNCRREWHQIELVCSYCGKKFRRKKSYLKNHGGKTKRFFCSPECQYSFYRGENSPLWRGGIKRKKDGYIMVFDPQLKKEGKYPYRYLHRKIIEEKLGVRLPTHLQVHHLNGKRNDNSPENLIVLPNGLHQRLHSRKCELLASTAVWEKNKRG